MRWIQDPVTHELIPADQYQQKARSGIEIVGDIEPYRSMIDGSVITSRSRHREHLRQHGCVEVGNDSSLSSQPKPRSNPPGLKEAIARSMEIHMKRRKTRR